MSSLRMLVALAAIAGPPTHARKHHRCPTQRCDRIWGRRHHWHPKPKLRETIASWYGPQDSGGPLACGGGDLTSSTAGVANKTLPCGTRLRICLEKRGPCTIARVVARGPFVAGREFDLTEATARAIGFLGRGVGPVWVAIA